MLRQRGQQPGSDVEEEPQLEAEAAPTEEANDSDEEGPSADEDPEKQEAEDKAIREQLRDANEVCYQTLSLFGTTSPWE